MAINTAARTVGKTAVRPGLKSRLGNTIIPRPGTKAEAPDMAPSNTNMPTATDTGR